MSTKETAFEVRDAVMASNAGTASDTQPLRKEGPIKITCSTWGKASRVGQKPISVFCH